MAIRGKILAMRLSGILVPQFQSRKIGLSQGSGSDGPIGIEEIEQRPVTRNDGLEEHDGLKTDIRLHLEIVRVLREELCVRHEFTPQRSCTQPLRNEALDKAHRLRAAKHT